MSLEQAISDHASALRELAAAIRSTLPSASSGQVIKSAEMDKAVDKIVADAKKPAATASSATASSASGAKQATTEVKAAAPAADESAAPTYETVKAKVLAVSTAKGRDTLVALLARHGVTKAPDLKAVQYPDIIRDAEAILDGTYDPEAAELA